MNLGIGKNQQIITILAKRNKSKEEYFMSSLRKFIHNGKMCWS